MPAAASRRRVRAVDAQQLQLEIARVQARLRLAESERATAMTAYRAQGVLAWAEAHRRIEGQPFSLARFRPLEAIYADDHPHKVIIKAAQRGVSEYAINLAMVALDVGAQLWAPDKEGLNVGYLFPTLQAVSDFSKERVAGLKRETPKLRAMFSGYDDVTFKEIGASYLYMRGARSEHDLHSFSADLLIRDEYDRMDVRARALAEKRLGASTIGPGGIGGRLVDLSTPTVPGAGIDAAYAGSDQHVWEVACPACGVWSELPFFTTVRLDGQGYEDWQRWDGARVAAATPSVCCPRCEALIDHCGSGRWRALRPDVQHIRGYRVPWYGFPFVNLLGIARDLVSADPTTVTEAHRSNLGLAFVPKGARVDPGMVLRAGCGPPSGAWVDVTMGVDVGSVLHYRISGVSSEDGLAYVLDAGGVPDWAALSALLRHWQVRRCVIDAHPELHKCQEWQAQHPDVVIRALYPTEKALEGRLYGDVNEEEGLLHINRTMAMDALYAALASGPEHAQGERWGVAVVVDAEVQAHLTAPVRVLVTDDKGQSRATWTHTAPDHLFHASVYDRAARALLPSQGVFF